MSFGKALLALVASAVALAQTSPWDPKGVIPSVEVYNQLPARCAEALNTTTTLRANLQNQTLIGRDGDNWPLGFVGIRMDNVTGEGIIEGLNRQGYSDLAGRLSLPAFPYTISAVNNDTLNDVYDFAVPTDLTCLGFREEVRSELSSFIYPWRVFCLAAVPNCKVTRGSSGKMYVYGFNSVDNIGE